jgi:hypothetical protein
MILIQERLTLDSEGARVGSDWLSGVVWIDRTTVHSEEEAKQWIEADDRKREGYRLIPIDPSLPVREVEVEVVPAVRFVPKAHEFSFQPPTNLKNEPSGSDRES